MKPNAILLVGQLRCVDQNLLAFLESAHQTSHVFIVTDKGFQAEAVLLQGLFNGEVYFSEDATESETGVSHNQLHLVHPEHSKLEIALNRLVAWEKANIHRFLYIHRLRTDIIYQGPLDDYILPLTQSKRYSNSLIFANWCTNYSGTRDSMLNCLVIPISAVNTSYQLKRCKLHMKIST